MLFKHFWVVGLMKDNNTTTQLLVMSVRVHVCVCVCVCMCVFPIIGFLNDFKPILNCVVFVGYDIIYLLIKVSLHVGKIIKYFCLICQVC